ncbi:MAG TPA: NTP transferase domain-containing protein [Syntrophobacteraceae bacterium]|nr:NTP transferase domain-containing protein [Syntrophobacteraceae bacterium]
MNPTRSPQSPRPARRFSGDSAAAAVVFAAGKGTRMVGYQGNKTLLPLIPGGSPYNGERPLLLEVLSNLPPGPKGIVVHHCARQVKEATAGQGAVYLFQPSTNGTGGALLSARPFLEKVREDSVLITMGDVPLIRSRTYGELLTRLDRHEMMILAFEPRDRAQYGMLEMEEDRVTGIVEWKYWHAFPPDRQAALRYCNAGVYAVRRPVLLDYMSILATRPHRVQKQRGTEWVTIEEFFLTDLVEWMSRDGLSVGWVTAPEEEVCGVDTPESLRFVQEQYARRKSGDSGRC